MPPTFDRAVLTELRTRAELGMVPLAGWYDVPTGLFDKNAWWTGANMLEVTIDYARETGDPTYISLIDNSFVKNQSSSFLNDYYDDEGWWALTWIKAYDLSHQQKYLDMAKTIFHDMSLGWDDKCGGGVYWRKMRDNKNAIPNELFLTIAARLHLRTPGDTGAGSYLDWAQREWTWFKGTGMIGADHQIVDGLAKLSDCSLGGPAYSYNQGVILGGLTDLAAATNDPSLLDAAQSIADAALEKMTEPGGAFIEKVCDPKCGEGDGVQFKGVFARNLAYLYRARPLPKYQAFLQRQSDVIWDDARNDQNQFGQRWAGPFDKGDASRQSSALDAIVGAVRAAHPNVALGATATASASCGAQEGGDRALDGSSSWNSKWCAPGAGDQTLTVDLGSVRWVVGFRVRHAGAGGEDKTWNTRDFEIETSTDNQSFSAAVSVTGNTADVTSHPIAARAVRYARLHVTTGQTAADAQAVRIYEFESLGLGW